MTVEEGSDWFALALFCYVCCHVCCCFISTVYYQTFYFFSSLFLFLLSQLQLFNAKCFLFLLPFSVVFFKPELLSQVIAVFALKIFFLHIFYILDSSQSFVYFTINSISNCHINLSNKHGKL